MHGIVLAAGDGRRMGTPKALLVDDDGTSWLRRSVATLAGRWLRCGHGRARCVGPTRRGPCSLGQDVTVVLAADWSNGMAASLRAGLAGIV